MQKTKTKIITALLLSALTLALFPMMAFASTGNILINDAIAPQDLPIAAVPAGGNISLNFNQVTFSGSQFYLLFSADGLSQVSAGDLRYTTIFNVAVVMDPLVTQMPADPSFPGQWTVGQGWVNGTIPLNIPGGTFYIKAFDGATTALAVTQGIPVIASFTIVPTSGAAGTPLLLNGNAFPLGSLVNVTYVNAYTNPASLVTVSNLTATGIYGNFSIPIPAPDLKQAAATGDNAPATNTVTFTAQDNKTGVIYTAIYTENQRGLLQIGRPRTGSGGSAIAGNLQNATVGIYGNNTVFTLVGGIGVGDSLRIAGNWFYPGAMSIKWDNSLDITPAGLSANNTGYFNTTTTVPVTGLGLHNITLVDSNLVVFVVWVNVVQSITISPTSGPIGTTVTVNGYGFPAAGVPTGNAYNVTITFGALPNIRAWALTDATGFFTTSFNVPAGSAGGANTVTATANDTLLTSASKTFTVTANFIVNPTSFYANSTNAVAASGTGFPASTAYFVAIDNLFSPFTNTTNGVVTSTSGVLNFTFLQAGFQPGLHVVAIYLAGSGSGANAPAAFANFTVLADPLTSDTGLLNAINNTVTSINSTQGNILSNLTAIGANVTSIKGSVVTIQTTLGTITTNLTSIDAKVTAIQGNTATLSTSIGTITTSISGMQSAVNTMSGQVSGLSASISSISSSVAQVNTAVGALSVPLANLDAKIVALNDSDATISTSLGTITTSLQSIGTTVTSNGAGIATIQTTLGTIQGTMATKDGVTSVQTALGTVQTDLTAVKTDVASNKTSTESLSPLIIVAIVLALIAAIAAIASIVLMRRKIAG